MLSIRSIIAEEYKLFLEGKAEDLIERFPELQPAYDMGIRNPQYLQWIQKRRAGEPVEDVADLVKKFDAVKSRLKQAGKSPDIYGYKTAGLLRQAIEDLGASKSSERRRLKQEETTYLGTFGDWLVAMPHTRESSCQLGKGTTWCTAATETQNLFLSYVARDKQNIILYYLIKKGGDSRRDPTAKISVGFVNGEPYLEGTDGHITVDAANKGYTESELRSVLGDQYDPIMDAMKAHAVKIAGRHPAKQQLIDIAQSDDPRKFDVAIRGMEGEELTDFMTSILRLNPSAQILDRLFDIENERIQATFDLYGEDYRYRVLDGFLFEKIMRSANISDITFDKALQKYGKFGQFGDIIESKVDSDKISQSQINKYVEFIKKNNALYYGPHRPAIRAIARSKATSPEILSFLYKNFSDESGESGIVDEEVLSEIGTNPNAPLEILNKILRFGGEPDEFLPPDSDVAYEGILYNKSFSNENLQNWFKENEKENKLKFISGIMRVSSRIVEMRYPLIKKLAQDPSSDVRKAVASLVLDDASEYTKDWYGPGGTLEKLIFDEDYDVGHRAIKRIKNNSNLLNDVIKKSLQNPEKYSFKPIFGLLIDEKNPSSPLPPEVIREIYNADFYKLWNVSKDDPDKQELINSVRTILEMYLVNFSTTPIDVLEKIFTRNMEKQTKLTKSIIKDLVFEWSEKLHNARAPRSQGGRFLTPDPAVTKLRQKIFDGIKDKEEFQQEAEELKSHMDRTARRKRSKERQSVMDRRKAAGGTVWYENSSRKKNSKTSYSEGKFMDFTEEYIKQVIKEEYDALLDEKKKKRKKKKKKACKPAKGKRFAKRVNGKCRSYGQAGQAKGGGDRIRPGTKKGDAYCARSAKIKKCKNPPCANDLSRKKWKCRGSKSMK
jgi:hypothetical protein